MNKLKTRDITAASLLLAMIIIFAVTPLGYLRINPTTALTLIHIPVIIGSIILGPGYGAFLGFAFGMSSFLTATFAPDATSFAFSPFYSVGEFHGNLWSIVIAFVPRILVGITPWLVYKGMIKFMKFKGGNTISLATAGVVGSLTNTLLVLGLMWIFFSGQLATLIGTVTSLLYKIIFATILTNGIPEAILAGVVTAAICKAVQLAVKPH